MIETAREEQAKRLAEIDEKKILEEIESSFCVAGYEVIQSAVFRESIREAREA